MKRLRNKQAKIEKRDHRFKSFLGKKAAIAPAAGRIFLLLLLIGAGVYLPADWWKIEGSIVKTLIDDRAVPELVLQTGHSAAIGAVVFGPGQSWLATAGFDNTIKIWDARTGRELRSLNGHTGAVKALAASPDGKLIASGGNDRVIRIWDAATGEQVRQFAGHEPAVESLAFDPAGGRLASGGADSKVRIWNAAGGDELAVLTGHAAWVRALTFSGDGSVLASGGADGVLKLWNARTGKHLRTIKKHTGGIKALAFSSDGQHIASGGEDSRVMVRSVGNGREAAGFDLPPLSAALSLRFGTGGDLSVISADGMVRLLDIRTKQQIKKRSLFNDDPAGETDAYRKAESAAFSPDGQTAALGGGDSSIIIQNIDGAGEKRVLQAKTGGIKSAAVSRNGDLLAAGGSDHQVKLWDLRTGQQLPSLEGHSGYVTGIAVDPEGRKVYSSSIDGTIRIWNPYDRAAASAELRGHRGSVQSIAVSETGELLLSGGFDQTVRLWDTNTGREIHTFTGHQEEITAVSFSRQNLAASGGIDKKIILWDMGQKKMIRDLETDGAVASLAFSSDGKLLASGGGDKTVQVWETGSGRLVKTIDDYAEPVNALTFSPEGQFLYAAGQDRSLSRRHLMARDQISTVKAHDDVITSMALHPNGEWLFTGSEDGSINLWRTGDLSKAATLVVLREPDEWLTVAPNGAFDGSEAAWNQILWRFGRDTFNVKPVEVFWSEFFRPGLLAELLEGKSFDRISGIGDKDRRQPKLSVDLSAGKPENGKAAIGSRSVRIKVAVEEAPVEDGFKTGSGARDVRLFRNGSLVRLWSGDVLPPGGGKTVLEADVDLVAGQNHITAYAFNRDNIKSVDAELKLTGAESLRRKGNAYIIAVGIGKSEDPKYDLSFVEADAAAAAAELSERQSRLGVYEKVEVLPLLNEAATKKNILAALGRLSGSRADPPPADGSFPVFLQKIRKSEPEDTVIIYFSGHGTARGERFFMLPYDIGSREPLRAGADRIREILDRSISDTELEKVLREVDARNLLLIIDACHSGQAIESGDARQGPTNAKGLAQLAYDKGMSILTASQSSEAAYVSKSLRLSYLTFALIEEGLKTSLADKNPADEQISLREWFDFAAARVPQLRDEVNRRRSLTEENKDLLEEEIKMPETTQRPRVFYRRQKEPEPFIVTKITVPGS